MTVLTINLKKPSREAPIDIEKPLLVILLYPLFLIITLYAWGRMTRTRTNSVSINLKFIGMNLTISSTSPKQSDIVGGPEKPE